MPVEAKRFEEPDELVTFERGLVRVVTVGSMTLGHETAEPGWRWSKHVKPIVGTEWCEFHHAMYVLSGRMRVVMRDGETVDIAGGEVVDIPPGHDAWVVGEEAVTSIDLQGVVGWARPPEPGERVLTTVLFTDIVESTRVAEELGDAAWRRVLASHQEDARSLLAHHRGRMVNTTGDGFVATFDAPMRAVRCALELAEASRRLGIEVRAGIHTGEVEMAEGDLRGLAVHLAARIMGAADPGTIFVSGTTRELMIGGQIDFVDRGPYQFRGISGSRTLYEARLRG
ncbi:MAG TPA: adenylate/guanylate cyclase domain-containing protein [Candidatus Limnocylindria bacterium]|nr:adenylate/guanylate cyclase domain-containing protein [Candidatus Limnocylindria bacterium]